MTNMKDKIFTVPIKKNFEFDEDVAAVFDDMLVRSIPFYQDMQSLVKSLIYKFIQLYKKENIIIYDLGCSTASTLLHVESLITNKKIELIGIDNSSAMIKQAHHKINALNSDITLYLDDIIEFNYKKTDIFISNYTLQFIRPLMREKFIKKLYTSLNKDGVFIFSEKLISQHKILNKILIDTYYEFKEKNGYSKYEIMQKREALENVLVPYSETENINMIKKCGFSHCEVIFRWGNFATFVAFK